MDDTERKSLEKEVQSHLHRIEKINESLRDTEQNIAQVVDAPPELRREVDSLRLELRGRKAALAVGLSLLNIFAE
jgi:peptidoglycan hydrolase CwlO-like protein